MGLRGQFPATTRTLYPLNHLVNNYSGTCFITLIVDEYCMECDLIHYATRFVIKISGFPKPLASGITPVMTNPTF